MKTTTISILISVLCFLSLACKTEAPQPTDPLDLLPPATQTGENTLGFLIDGEPWMPNRIFQGDYRKSDGRFNIYTRDVQFDEGGNPAGSSFSIGSVSVPVYEEGTYQITERGNLSAVIDFLTGCTYWSFSENSGELFLSRIDTINRVMAGTFHFKAISEDCSDTLSITHGRFDVSF